VISKIKEKFFQWPVSKELVQKLSIRNQGHKKKVIIQCDFDVVSVLKFAIAYKALSHFENVSPLVISNICSFERSGGLQWLKRRKFFERSWWNFFIELFGVSKIEDYNLNRTGMIDTYHQQAKAFLKEINTKREFLNFRYKNIHIGDLLYDTYMRYKPHMTIELEDPFLLEVMAQGIYILDKCEEILNENEVSYVFSTFSSYIKHGILCRIALDRGINVITFALIDKPLRFLKPSYPLHLKDITDYHEFIASSLISEADLNKARASLEMRFKGINDTATFYMNKSSFASDKKEMMMLNPDEKKCLIYLHCFFDSPHIYRSMLFVDFYEWLEETIQYLLKKSDYKIYIKRHPNSIDGNEFFIKQFEDKYPQINFLPKNFGSKEVVENKFDVALTVHGTMAHELPWFNIPVLCAGDNPHTGFNFCVTPKNIESYEQYLSNLELVKQDTKFDKTDILKFYYCHNLRMDNERCSEDETVDVLDFNRLSSGLNWALPVEDKVIDLIAKLEKIYGKIFKAKLT
jgi:hypothetical protein